MKYFKYYLPIITACFLSCNQNTHTETAQSKADTSEKEQLTQIPDGQNIESDKKEIRDLIRTLLKWSETKNNVDVLPLKADAKDSLYIGFDFDQLKKNLNGLKSIGFFSSEFIDNYNRIILKLDEKMRKNEIEKWSTGEIPPFAFAGDVNAWCNCQDTPGSWDIVEVYPIKLNTNEGALYWNWSNLNEDFSPEWKEFKYKFKVKKKDGKWKISYMEGFDYKMATK